MLAPNKIFLVRHGQSEWNGQKRISGQADPALTLKGRQQALSLEKVLRGEKLAAIYTSPLQRARATAEPTAEFHGLTIETRAELKEIHFGVLQGRFRDGRDPEAERMWAEREEDKTQFKFPGGENFLELEARVMPCLQTILAAHAGETILFVGHRSTNRVLLGALLQWPRETYIDLDLSGKYLYEIKLGNQPRIATIRLDEEKCGQRYERFKT